MADVEPVLLREPRGGVPDIIDTPRGFFEFCDRFAGGTGSIAIDAERACSYRYDQQDWLVQFKREGAGIALVDPVAIASPQRPGELPIGPDEWERFNVLAGESHYIIHDAAMDLPGFARIGLKPKKLFDTKTAARLLGAHRFGLSALTEHYLGLTLAKEHSAADWSYRPLPRDWRAYAALDVELLIELENALTAELKQAGKWEWALQEFAYELASGLGEPKKPPVPWLHISKITELGRDRRGLAVAKALWEQRDELAREYDIDPGLLLEDSTIIEAAKKKPHNAAQFRSVRSLNERVKLNVPPDRHKMFERYAPIQRKVKPSVWKTAIQHALDLPDDELPTIPHRPTHDAGEGEAPKNMKVWRNRHPDRFARFQRARKAITTIAQDTHTPPDVLLKPQIVRNLCWSDEPRADVAGFLAEHGARDWQVALCAPSLSRAIM
ncbi:HRDC domain-containing protein [Bifidobacterium choloepi]|uniref:Ribonuclease D n=1 Tax=Bifidobacterium choloepi TaxID=2614131 RepID=A0A6I5N8K7_9BIFI|nr:ribonuclease D [Bifidobacterium choloepi]